MSKQAKLITAAVAVVLIATVVVIISRSRQPPRVTVKLRVAVMPPDETRFVAAQMGSARFKYLAGKLSGVSPTEAQKLVAIPRLNSSFVDGEIHVGDKGAAEKYAAGFLETLQLVCGTQAQVAVTESSIR